MLFCLRATSLLGDCRIKRKGIVCKFHKLSYICSPFLKRKCRGRVEIGRQARLRIWCREAYGFDSLRPHSKKAQLYSWAFFVGTSAEHAVEGNLRFLNPSQLRLQPLLGAYRPLPMVGSGVISARCPANISHESAAAPKRLRYARKCCKCHE